MAAELWGAGKPLRQAHIRWKSLGRFRNVEEEERPAKPWSVGAQKKAPSFLPEKKFGEPSQGGPQVREHAVLCVNGISMRK